MVDPESIVTAEPTGNADFRWDEFDSADYFEHNYHRLLPEDAEIIRIVADFFHEVAPAARRTRAIDVGSGANLYPAMTMLPFTSEIVLYERAKSNREWLRKQLRQPAESWHQFWHSVRGTRRDYCRVTDPFDALGQTSRVVEGDLFDLEPGQYDIGTMFFVAESITTRTDEFRHAIQLFVHSLVEGAPFAMTFMRKSSGYQVGNRLFPACWVTEYDVRRCLSEIAEVREVRVIDSHDLRDGYSGMIVAYGHRK
jgi:hypothetical protein